MYIGELATRVLESPRLLVFTGAVVSIAFPVIYAVYQRCFSPLSKVPGPFWASVTPLWRVYRVLKGNWNLENIALHEKYGDYVRIAPNEVSSTSPSVVQKAYGHSGNAWQKADWYHTWYVKGRVHPFFAETDPQQHRDLRRRVSKAYSMSYILAMESFIDPLVGKLGDEMRKREGTIVDMADWTQYFAFDVIGELAFGRSFGFLEHGTDHNGLLSAVYKYMTVTAALGWTWNKAYASSLKITQWILNNSFLKTVHKRITCNPRDPFEKLVVAKMEVRSNPDRNDLLTHFQNVKKTDGSLLTESEVFEQSQNAVGAGADTTAISVRAIIRFVCATPRVQKRLQAEIDGANEKGQLSPIVQYAEAQNLPYFQAVVKECLRLFPAVGYQLPRLAPKGGASIDDIYFLENSVLGVNGWSLHRNKDIFGEDADEFRPERWLEGDTKAKDNCYATFGFGSRTCVGKNMAMLEINKLLPTIFRDFDIDICNIEHPWTVVTAWFTYQSDFPVRFRCRNPIVTGDKSEEKRMEL